MTWSNAALSVTSKKAVKQSLSRSPLQDVEASLVDIRCADKPAARMKLQRRCTTNAAGGTRYENGLSGHGFSALESRSSLCEHFLGGVSSYLRPKGSGSA